VGVTGGELEPLGDSRQDLLQVAACSQVTGGLLLSFLSFFAFI
jgi:hypothetical protein